MKIWMSNKPTTLRESIFENTFMKKRLLGILFGFNTSTCKFGKQMTKIWCGVILSKFVLP